MSLSSEYIVAKLFVGFGLTSYERTKHFDHKHLCSIARLGQTKFPLTCNIYSPGRSFEIVYCHAFGCDSFVARFDNVVAKFRLALARTKQLKNLGAKKKR